MHSQWHVPETHYLETWSDARAGDGTVTICQPLIEPLYECRSAHEVIAALAGESKTPIEIVRDFWRANWEGRAAGTFGTLTDADRRRLRRLREVLAARAARRLRARHRVHAEDGGARRRRGGGGARRGAGLRARGHVPRRSVGLRRPLRQQRLAPGTAQAVRQGLLGQRRLHQSEDGRIAQHGGAQARRLRHRGLRRQPDRQRPQPAGAPVGHAGPAGRVDCAAPRLRPHQRRPHRQRPRLQRQLLPLLGDPVGAAGRVAGADRPDLQRGLHAGPLPDGEPRADPGRDARAVRARAHVRAAHGARPQAGRVDVRAVEVRGPRLGHGHRPELLHRLQRLRRRLRRREQHPGRRQAAGDEGPRDALAAHRPLLGGLGRRAVGPLPAGRLPALRERALRGGLPGRRDHAQRRRPERHGLQPLRRHALLLAQLPVQGPPLQLPAVRRLGHADAQDAAQPGRHGPQPRRHGEVHLLRPAHQQRAAAGQDRGPQDQGRRDRDRLRGGLPDPGDRVRRPERQEQPRRQGARGSAQLRPARRAEHASAHDLSSPPCATPTRRSRRRRPGPRRAGTTSPED